MDTVYIGRRFYTIALLLLMSLFVNAQNDVIWSIETKSGNEFLGTITSQDENSVTIKYRGGESTILRKDIRRMQIKDKVTSGNFVFENPHPSRYFFGPSGYGLKAGEGYFQNTWLFFNQVSYGITNNFSMGVGFIPVFLLGGGFENTPIWLTPKISIPLEKDKVNLGVGAIMGTLPGQKSWIGMAYGASTFGNRNSNVTFGLGYGYADKDWAKTPLYSLAGMLRISKGTYLLTENYFLKTSDATVSIISFGARSTGKRLAIDYGLWIPLGELTKIPWLGITVPFGNTRN